MSTDKSRFEFSEGEMHYVISDGEHVEAGIGIIDSQSNTLHRVSTMTDDELRALIMKAQELAARVGPQHAMWDVISDAESILNGSPALVGDRPYIERILLAFVGLL